MSAIPSLNFLILYRNDASEIIHHLLELENLLFYISGLSNDLWMGESINRISGYVLYYFSDYIILTIYYLKWKLLHSTITNIQLLCDRSNHGHDPSFSWWSTKHHTGVLEIFCFSRLQVWNKYWRGVEEDWTKVLTLWHR